MMDKAKKKQKDIPFIDMVNSMYDKRAFCIVTLRRKVFPYYKTRLSVSGNYLRFTHRVTGYYFYVKFEPLNDCYLITVNRQDLKFELFIQSNKHFLQKLIKYDFLHDRFDLPVYVTDTISYYNYKINIAKKNERYNDSLSA